MFSEEHVELGAKLFGAMMDFPARQEITTINKGQILDLVPIFRKSYPLLGILETGSGDLDPASMWAGYRKGILQSGGVIVNDAELMEAHYSKKTWHVSTKVGNFRARRLVNAAGAWGDFVAERSGVRPIGLSPMIRTALVVQPAEANGRLKAELPFVFLPSDELYFRVQNGSITMSPADETPTVPGDAQPDMVDIATTIEKFKTVTTVVPEARKPKAWAGLRTFTPDKNPAIGFDLENPAFFWLVGQGGFGIESAPAASALAAAIFQGQEVPEYLLRLGFSFSDISPTRFTKVVA